MVLAIEDVVSEAALCKVLNLLHPKIDTCELTIVGKKGKGYLEQKARELNRSASSVPVILVTDQDSPRACPNTIRCNWIRSTIKRKMIFRVAVFEIESWFLADRVAFSAFLSIPLSRIPNDTDMIIQPKEFIVNLARCSKSSKIREELVPTRGSTATVGPVYNTCLVKFINDFWNPQRASGSSHSLRKALYRISQLHL